MDRASFGRRNKYTLIRVGLVSLGLIMVIGLFSVVRSRSNSASNAEPSVAGVSDSIRIADAIDQQTINREFRFPLLSNTGEEVSKIRYIIESAELREEIIVQGQRATAIQGRAFLIIHIRVTNEYSQGIDINTRDYLRLGVNNENEWLAADIHNDPTEVQAISTKRTRLGFPISTSDTNLVLQIGEINGPKQRIPLELSFQ